MMHHKAPHRNQAAPLDYLGFFGDKVFDVPETFFDSFSTRCPASESAENKVKELYWTNDLKMDMPAGNSTDPGNGGGSYMKFDAYKSYQTFLERMTEEQRTKWEDFYKPLSDAFYADGFDQAWGPDQAQQIEVYQRMMRDYMQSIAAVDDSIGQVLKYLEDTDQLDNTLIVYTSDQGFFLGEHGFMDKRFMYEPTIHTPLLMRYPKLIEKGSTQDKMTINADYGATFLDLAGIEIPEEVQGESLIPLMTQDEEASKDWRKSMYYHYYEYPGWHQVRRHYGVRTDRHKLIHFYGQGTKEFDGHTWEMYDFVNDPHELVNLYGMPQYAELQAELTTELDRLMKYYKDTEFDPSELEDAFPEDTKIQWFQDKIKDIMTNMEILPDADDFFHDVEKVMDFINE